MPRSSPSSTSNSEPLSSIASTASSYTQLADLARRSPSPYVSPYGPVPGSVQSIPAGYRSRSSNSPALSTAGSRTGENSFAPPSPQSYDVAATIMSSGRALSSAEKSSLLQSLKTHRVNTLIELRRIEKALATSKTADVQEALTQAWAHYVNSNNLLSELRGLTKSYPFSSECLDEAKWMVISDSQSLKSWNYCWLVLQKAKNQNLIPKHARQLAAKPAMWGSCAPTPQGVEQLTAACVAQWTQALNQMLRHWDVPPMN